MKTKCIKYISGGFTLLLILTTLVIIGIKSGDHLLGDIRNQSTNQVLSQTH